MTAPLEPTTAPAAPLTCFRSEQLASRIETIVSTDEVEVVVPTRSYSFLPIGPSDEPEDPHPLANPTSQ